MLTQNQLQLSKNVAQFLVDLEGQIPGEAGEWSQQLASDIATAQTAANGAKTTPVQLANDAFSIATSVATEVGNPKVIAFMDALQNTEQDAVNDKVLALVPDLISDWKTGKGL